MAVRVQLPPGAHFQAIPVVAFLFFLIPVLLLDGSPAALDFVAFFSSFIWSVQTLEYIK